MVVQRHHTPLSMHLYRYSWGCKCLHRRIGGPTTKMSSFVRHSGVWCTTMLFLGWINPLCMAAHGHHAARIKYSYRFARDSYKPNGDRDLLDGRTLILKVAVLPDKINWARNIGKVDQMRQNNRVTLGKCFCGPALWPWHVALPCGPTLWPCHMEIPYEALLCGPTLWPCPVALFCGPAS